MATNFPEKQRWVASLEAIVKSTQCKDDFHRNVSVGNLPLISFTEDIWIPFWMSISTTILSL